MRDGFFDHRDEKKRHVVAGAFLNKSARDANSFAFRRPSGYAQHEYQGHLAGSSIAPQMIVGVGVVTSHANTCEASADSQESFDAPCRRESLYRFRLRYHDYDDGKWKEYDEEFDLDASWARDLSSDYSVDLPAMPPLKTGDQVVVGFDEQRGKYIPIFHPPKIFIARTSSAGIRGRCGAEVCTADVQVAYYDNDLDPDITGCHDLKPALDDDGAIVTRKCANLGLEDVPGNAFIPIYQEGVSGEFFTLGIGSESRLYKGRSRGCHRPGGSMAYDLMRYSDATETWSFTGRIVLVQDPHFANFVLPGEIIWIVQGDSSSGGGNVNQCGASSNPLNSNQQKPWFTLGSFGLFRVAVTTSEIGCNDYGSAKIYYHPSAGCSKVSSGCIVPICNDWGFPKDLAKDEEIKIRFFERTWQIINEPEPILARATLYTDMKSTDETVRVTLEYFLDRCSTETVEIGHNYLCLHGAEGDIVILARDITLDNGWLILAVKRHPHILLAQTFSGGISAYDGVTLGSGLVNVARRKTADDSIELVAGVENIFSVFNAHGKIRGDTNIFIIREEDSDDWYVLEPMMPIVQGQQVGALLDTDASNALDNIEHLAGYGALIIDATSSITADNDFGWDADDNAVTYAFLNADGEWKMFQVQCPA